MECTYELKLNGVISDEENFDYPRDQIARAQIIETNRESYSVEVEILGSDFIRKYNVYLVE